MDLMARLAESGMLLASARGPIPNVAEIVAGEPITGSWWGHPAGHAIFNQLNALAESPDVIRMRLINGKVTLVHRRIWPALARVAETFSEKQLAILHEVHTASGAHRVEEESFASWLPADVRDSAAKLTIEQAWSLLPACLRR
jgi:hypothetical protein